jgi:hypothetical protein
MKLTPHRLLSIAYLSLLALLLLGAVLVAFRTPAAPATGSVRNPLYFADGEPVSGGHWSVLCIGGVAYLTIETPSGHAFIPKFRKNGLVERCALPDPES